MSFMIPGVDHLVSAGRRRTVLAVNVAVLVVLAVDTGIGVLAATRGWSWPRTLAWLAGPVSGSVLLLVAAWHGRKVIKGGADETFVRVVLLAGAAVVLIAVCWVFRADLEATYSQLNGG